MNDISSLVTAAELSAKLKNLVSEARILELAESKMIPHYSIDEHIMFPIARAKQWILNNFVVYHAGEEIGGQGIVTTINVVSPSPENTLIPVEIRGVSSFLIPLALESVESVSTTGVYFLCSREKSCMSDKAASASWVVSDNILEKKHLILHSFFGFLCPILRLWKESSSWLCNPNTIGIKKANASLLHPNMRDRTHKQENESFVLSWRLTTKKRL